MKNVFYLFIEISLYRNIVRKKETDYSTKIFVLKIWGIG